ncbi:MAG: uracil-DNA glycosylase family protein [Pseudomonadota bacterium]
MPAPIVKAIDNLNEALCDLKFGKSVFCTYNPLEYAFNAHLHFLKKYGAGSKRVLFLGMNPGPYGMVQTGIPFGEISMVRDWMGIELEITPPETVHPKRPVIGFHCQKSEVSGQRFWSMMASQFESPENFFASNMVVNYCPLVWMTESGKNITPDKLPSSVMKPVYKACDEYFVSMLDYYQPEVLVGVGAFAEKQLRRMVGEESYQIGRMLHPSPASPIANKHWPQRALEDLAELGVL